MSFALKVRCISKPFKNINRTFQNAIETKAIYSAEDIYGSQHVRCYNQKNQNILPPPRITIFHPAKLSNISSNYDNYHPSDSPYPIYNACLGPFIDSRFWFAETNPEDACKEDDYDSIAYTEENRETQQVSLEQLRKMLKEKNLKSSESPPVLSDLVQKQMELGEKQS